MKKFTVSENCTLKQFTDVTYPQGSFCWNVLCKKRDIRVNGTRVGTDVPLFVGDEVTYFTTQKQEQVKSHRIVYEDENLLICDKFSGVTSEGLLSELCESGSVYALHRLDRNTQGLLAFARTKEAERELLLAFREKRVEKRYLALCKNGFVRQQALLNGWLKKDEKNAFVRIYDAPTEGGEPIVTEYRVKERRGDLALTEITLHTGKTHQIRAHMAHIGCPVLGDEKYGDRVLNRKYAAKRQRLVAKYLAFRPAGAMSYLNGKIFTSGFDPEP